MGIQEMGEFEDSQIGGLECYDIWNDKSFTSLIREMSENPTFEEGFEEMPYLQENHRPHFS